MAEVKLNVVVEDSTSGEVFGKFTATGQVAFDKIKQSGTDTFTKLESESANACGKITGALDTVRAKWAELSLAIGAIYGAYESIVKATDKTKELATETYKLQRITGDSAESMSTMLAVAHRYSIDFETLQQMIVSVSRRMGGLKDIEASVADETGKGVDVFEKFGITIKNNDGTVKAFSDVFTQIRDRIQQTTNPTEQLAIATQFFRGTAAQLMPLLTMTDEKYKELAEDAQKYGLVLTGENVASVREFSMANKDLEEATTGVKVAIGLAIMPVLAQFSKEIAGNTKDVGEFAGTLTQLLGGALKFVVGLLQADAAVALAFYSAILRLGEGVAWLQKTVGLTAEVRAEGEKNFQMFKEAAETAWGAAGDLATKGADNMSSAFNKVGTSAKTAGEDVKTGGDKVVQITSEMQQKFEALNDQIGKQADSFRRLDPEVDEVTRRMMALDQGAYEAGKKIEEADLPGKLRSQLVENLFKAIDEGAAMIKTQGAAKYKEAFDKIMEESMASRQQGYEKDLAMVDKWLYESVMKVGNNQAYQTQLMNEAAEKRIAILEKYYQEAAKKESDNTEKSIKSLQDWRDKLVKSYDDAIQKADEYYAKAAKIRDVISQGTLFLAQQSGAKAGDIFNLEKEQLRSTIETALGSVNPDVLQNALKGIETFMTKYKDQKNILGNPEDMSEFKASYQSILDRLTGMADQADRMSSAYKDLAQSLPAKIADIDKKINELQTKLDGLKMEMNVEQPMQAMESIKTKMNEIRAEAAKPIVQEVSVKYADANNGRASTGNSYAGESATASNDRYWNQAATELRSHPFNDSGLYVVPPSYDAQPASIGSQAAPNVTVQTGDININGVTDGQEASQQFQQQLADDLVNGRSPVGPAVIRVIGDNGGYSEY